MPVHLFGTAATHDLLASACSPTGEFHKSTDNNIHIGLINNMPDGALQATERHFATLLDSASNGVPVHLSLYALPEVPRNDAGLRHVSRFYSAIENLWDSNLDGLIVTGAEPREPNLKEEPYWGSLTKVIDWAEHNTHSTIWSCLAAHAALQHTEGIGRRRLGEKRFGVFECARASEHQLTAGVPSQFTMPHSRWNDIPESELVNSGYRILTRARDGGPDAFVKQRKSLAVFFQGHPEYEAETLLLEYRRDIGRYLRRERDSYPPMPEGCFDLETSNALTALQQQALASPRMDLLADFPVSLMEQRVPNTWRPVATRIYGNWLAHLCAQKERRFNTRNPWKHLQSGEVGSDLPRVEAKYANRLQELL